MDRLRLGGVDPSYSVTLPRPAPPALNPAHFMLCGVACACPALAMWQLELYRWALAQAQEAARPSILERDLLAVWN